jgi:hypothetical protein
MIASRLGTVKQMFKDGYQTAVLRPLTVRRPIFSPYLGLPSDKYKV